MQGTESAKEELVGNTKLSHRLKEIIYACYKQFSSERLRSRKPAVAIVGYDRLHGIQTCV